MKKIYGKNINKKLKILIISQYFWPENFRINELCEELIKLGHEITILTGYPNYPKGKFYEDFIRDREKFSTYNGAKIIRVPIFPRLNNRLTLTINYLSFLFSSIFFGYFKLRNKNFDILFTFQLSPVTVGITSAFFSFIKNCPSIFWVLDLWPDTLIALNIIKRNWQIKIFKLLVNWIYKNCDAILAQSESILDEIRKYPSVPQKTLYFPCWSESNLFKNNITYAPEIKKKKLFTFLFAGNIGEAQDFKSIIKAVNIIVSKNIFNFRIIIIGEGSKKNWLKKEIYNLKISKYFEILDSYPIERMPSFFKHADALLVSLLNKEVFNITIPGKIQFYLTSGIPIFGMLSGEGAKVIINSKSGLVCESGDYISFAKILTKIINSDKSTLKAMGKNGKKYASQEFSKALLIKKLDQIINDLTIKKYIH